MRVLEYRKSMAPPGDFLFRVGSRPIASEGVGSSYHPLEAAENGDHPQAHELLLVVEHVVGEGGDDGGPHRADGSAIQGEPAGDGAAPWEVLSYDGGPREAADHEAEVAGVDSGSDGAGGDDEGGVEHKEPDWFEASGREAEKGSNNSRCACDEALVVTVVELEGEASKDGGAEEYSGSPWDRYPNERGEF